MNKPQSKREKINALVARGVDRTIAMDMVDRAEAFLQKAQAEAVKLAIRDLQLTERAAKSPPTRVHLRLRARQIQAQTKCELGPAILQAERERAVARAQAELAVKRVAAARQPTPAPATRAPTVTPVAPMPLAKGKTRLMSTKAVGSDDDDEPPILMVMHPERVFGK